MEPKPLAVLAIRALDEFDALFRLQQLIELALDQLDDCSDQARDKAALLLQCYQSEMSLHADELKDRLRRILLETRLSID